MPRAKQANPANNRHDLLTPSAPGRNLTTPGQQYGKQTSQEQSQRILPVGLPSTAGGGAVAPAPAPTGSTAPAAAPPPAGPPRVEPGDFMNPTLSPQAEQAAQALGNQARAQAATGEQGTLRSVLTHLASQPNASSLVRSLASSD